MIDIYIRNPAGKEEHHFVLMHGDKLTLRLTSQGTINVETEKASIRLMVKIFKRWFWNKVCATPWVVWQRLKKTQHGRDGI